MLVILMQLLGNIEANMKQKVNCLELKLYMTSTKQKLFRCRQGN